MLAIILAAALSGGSCANPSIISANVQSATSNESLNHYTLAISVENVGAVRQPSNLLQSIVVVKDGQRADRIGLQPLKPKQTQTVTYSFDRSADAGSGTTTLTFVLDFNGRYGNDVSCHGGDESTTIDL